MKKGNVGALALLVVATALAYGRAPLADVLAPLVPSLGAAFLRLGLGTLGGLLAVLGLAGLRHALVAAGKRIVATVDALETRAFASLTPLQARLVRAVVVGAVVGGSFLGVAAATRLTVALEARAVDLWFTLRFPQRSEAELATGAAEPPANQQDNVVVVALDNDTIARLGWPIPRHHYARLIDVVTGAKAASLTFDISLVDPHPDHPEWDAAVGEAARRGGPVFFTYTIVPVTAEQRPVFSETALRANEVNTIPLVGDAARLRDFSEILGGPAAPTMVIDPVLQGARGVAMANVLLDGGDELLRHSTLVARLGDRLYPSLSLRLASEALQVPLSSVRLFPGSHAELGTVRIPMDDLGRSLVRYQGRHSTGGNGPFRYVSMLSLIRADAHVTLAGNPMGEDQRFVIDDDTKVTVDGKAVPLLSVDPGRLKAGARVSGRAKYSSDPGRILEVTIETGAPPEEGEFELEDEDHLTFKTTLATLKPLAQGSAAFAGRHVLVGSTATAAADMRNTSLGAIPGVEHHATMLSNILRGDFIRPAASSLTTLLTLLIAILAALCGSLAGPGLGLLLAAFLALALMAGTFLAFDGGVHAPVIPSAASVAGSYLVCVLLGFRAERREKAKAEEGREFIRQTFGRYLTEQVVEELLDSPDGLKLGGQRRFVTIMMTDLRGFTSMCATMMPENVVALLNNYLAVMTAIINKYGGTIDEFIGDAILVVFGAPLQHEDDELRAVACAIEMLNAMDGVNAWNRSRNLPEVEMGIGIHSGEVVVGNIGSEMRAKYGIVGSTINLTSRVESYTVGGQVLISEVTRERCGEAITVGTSQTVSPKGVKGTLTIYEAIGVAPYNVKLASAEEELVPPKAPTTVRYALIKEKQVGDNFVPAVVEGISALGFELRTEAPPDVLANLLLRLDDGAGNLLPGDLYGKVLRQARPGVVYVRLTSVPAELRPVLGRLRGEGEAQPVMESALVSA